MKKIIGIDGGGTKTEFVLCDETGRVQKRIRLSASNPVDVGMEASCALLKEGICQLFVEKEPENTLIDGMFLGISGGSVSDNKEKIKNFIENSFPHAAFSNGSDAVNVLGAGLGDDDGVILIAGTGSVAFARKNGELYRAGGWGYLFDGAGGGYDLGQKAVQAALKAFDGTGEQTLLSSLLEEQLGMSADKALTMFYDKGKRFIASFAPLVFKAFLQKDAVAEQIIKEMVRHWVTLVKRVGEYVPHTRKVALAGSLFKQKDILMPVLSEELGDEKELLLTTFPPVFGALREAFKVAGITVDSEIEKNFFESYKKEASR